MNKPVSINGELSAGPAILFSYTSPRYFLKIIKPDDSWTVLYEDKLFGYGPESLRVDGSVGFLKIKLLAIRKLLPLIFFGSGACNEEKSLKRSLAPLAGLEELNLNSETELVQIFPYYCSCENNLEEALCVNCLLKKSHIYFSNDLCVGLLGLKFSLRSIPFNAEALNKLDKSRLSFFRDIVQSLNGIVAFNAEKIEGNVSATLDNIVKNPALGDAEKKVAIGLANECYGNQVYQIRKKASFVEAFVLDNVKNLIELRNSIDQFSSNGKLLKLEDKLQYVINNRKPYSLVRIGEGEGCFVSYGKYLSNKSKANEVYGIVGKDIFNIWFKRNLHEFPAEDYYRLVASYRDAIKNADYVGIPSIGRILFEYSHFVKDVEKFGHSRGYIGIAEVLKDVNNIFSHSPLVDRTIGCCDIARSLYFWQEGTESLSTILPKVLYGLPSVTVITCHFDLGARLAQRLQIGHVNVIQIPPEKGRVYGTDLDNVHHYSARYEQVLAKCSAMAGDIVLVSAGFLGKIYCSAIKEAGGIGIDIGSLADFWSGVETRAKNQFADVSPF